MSAVPPVDEAAALANGAAALGVAVAPGQAAALLRYLDAVLVLNEQLNLTAIRDRAQAVVLHVLDSLAFGLLGLSPAHVLDLGSGNGFPGVAVAVLHPRASVLLLDKTGKKVRAMGACLLTAGIAGVETLHCDAAQAPALHRDLRQAFDVVTARAVGAPEQVAALALPFLRPGGQLVLWLEEGAEPPRTLLRAFREQLVDYELPAPAARRRRLASYRRR